jgi:hypothetical protein
LLIITYVLIDSNVILGGWTSAAKVAVYASHREHARRDHKDHVGLGGGGVEGRARQARVRAALLVDRASNQRRAGERARTALHRRAGHLRFRDVRDQLVRAVLHQLRQRKAAAAVQPARLQAGAGGVRQGGDRVEADRFLRQPTLHRPH